jgi:hypothetical protein
MLLAAIASPLHLAHSNDRLQPRSASTALAAAAAAEQLGNELVVTHLQMAGNKNSDVMK